MSSDAQGNVGKKQMHYVTERNGLNYLSRIFSEAMTLLDNQNNKL